MFSLHFRPFKRSTSGRYKLGKHLRCPRASVYRIRLHFSNPEDTKSQLYMQLYSPDIFLYGFLVRHCNFTVNIYLYTVSLVRHRPLQSRFISIQFLGTSSNFTIHIYFYTVSWYVIDLYSPHIFLYSFLVRHRTLQSTYIYIQFPWYGIDLYSPHIFLYSILGTSLWLYSPHIFLYSILGTSSTFKVHIYFYTVFLVRHCNFTIHIYFYTFSWYVIVILKSSYISILYPWYVIDLYSPHISLYRFWVRHRTLQSTYISIQFLGTSSNFTVHIYFYTVSLVRRRTLQSTHMSMQFPWYVVIVILQSTYISIQYPWYVIELYSPHIFIYIFLVRHCNFTVHIYFYTVSLARHRTLQSTHISIQFPWYVVIVILQSTHISIQFRLVRQCNFTVHIYFYTVSWYVIELYSPHIFQYSILGTSL